MRHLSLFTGIGGFDLGFERAGMTTVGQVENAPYCTSILEKHWPDVWRHGDIRTLTSAPSADIISAGVPCQPVSVAGKREWSNDDRWLWGECFRVVRLVRPEWVVLENPTGILSLGFRYIADQLAAAGYSFTWEVLSACAFGAPHMRRRVFIVANPDSNRVERYATKPLPRFPHLPGFEGVRRIEDIRDRPDRYPSVFRGDDDGIPLRVDRLRALGNAVVPQVAEWVGRRIMGCG